MSNKISPCVLGLGYVGLPLFVRLNKKYHTIGLDTNTSRVKLLNNKKDVNKEIKSLDLKLLNQSKITSNVSDIKNCNFYIITVPTPLKKNNIPDLKYLEQAYKSISKYLKFGDVIVVESTVYPGLTKQLAKKIFEKQTNFKNNKDYHLAYSPERINPGDKKHQIQNTEKILAIESKNLLIKKKY